MNNAIIIFTILITFFAVSDGKICPDHKTRCTATQTCCSSSSKGSYGCCPYTNASCCQDGLHCCPHGSRCDIAHSRCIPTVQDSDGWTVIEKSFAEDELLSQNLLRENAGFQNETVGKTVCGTGEQTCPDKYTCCPLSTPGTFGCCPFNGATCCADKIHCCPNGKTCDVQGRRCL